MKLSLREKKNMIRRGLTLLSATRSVARNARPLSLSAMKLSENDNAEVSKENINDLFSNSERQESHPNNERRNRGYSVNHVQLIGGVVQDPVVRVGSNTKEFATLRVATNVSHRKANGETVIFTDFHDVIAFGGTAGFVRDRVKKGHRVYVTGRLNYNTVSTPEGFKFDKPSIVADVVHHFGTRYENH